MVKRFRFFLLLIFIGCKFQSQDLINTKFIIDKKFTAGDMYASKKLDQLFNVSGYSYFEPDYVGTSFESYYVKNIVIQDKSKNKSSYLLFFDNNDLLKDTLHIKKDQLYSLNVEFGNGRKGISVGSFNEVNSYFKINKNFELTSNLKLKPISINTEIIKCPLPVELLTEENIDLEDHFTFGINSQHIKPNKTLKKSENDFSIWKGSYHFSSKSRDGLKTSFDINIIQLNNVTVKYVNEGEPVEVYKNIKSEYVDKDKIKINFNPKYENMGIVFIEYADGDYYISGDPIYFINPGNEEMLLKKTD
ncbi:hypothetical protein [Chryseobacterium sp. CT-SW4]|uniref:hypothetical protein n=1 Tax=Chryseobacterium sp. SW-1 TaxID=3157343 RepID=UPI003B02A593